MQNAGTLNNQTLNALIQLAQTGLSGQEQGFNELISLNDLLKQGRLNKQKLDIINAYGSVGVPVGVG